jgi:hypothetical protein
VIVNCVYVCITFFVVSILLVAIAKVLTKIKMEDLTT